MYWFSNTLLRFGNLLRLSNELWFGNELWLLTVFLNYRLLWLGILRFFVLSSVELFLVTVFGDRHRQAKIELGWGVNFRRRTREHNTVIIASANVSDLTIVEHFWVHQVR